MTTTVMGCYQKETEPIDIPGRTPSGTSAPQPSAASAGEVIPSVDRQSWRKQKKSGGCGCGCEGCGGCGSQCHESHPSK
ncbi:hypothetical protein [Pseudoflavonifractor sp. MSJ-37]|uniref:hypothetical protein n=1 Tax=Pseudoflavonifractor sp. MSJ-37 TaxID=2841531 RepID=UPI001C1242EA|nr:hypothetical protein [Pseudoflavonifractor sp. MSJ-37]MBU5435475.1 hypothetical protein [Pseudoflavonifractor sp. MSJ-37]